MAKQPGLQTFESQRSVLPDGSVCEIAWQRAANAVGPAVKRTYLATRVADGIDVWGQIFSHDPRHSDPEVEAVELMAAMGADPSAFDRRRLWCVKCGAGANNRCEHPASHTVR